MVRLPVTLLLVRLCAAAAALLAVGPLAAAEPVRKAKIDYKKQIVPLVKKYCHECHGPKMQEAEVALHKYADEGAVLKDARTWEKVLEMLRFEAMPPDDKPQPTEAERTLLVEWLDQKLFHYDCDEPADPGRVTIRRLNRVDYNNTIRDLLGLESNPAKDFPSDDVGEGFDNIGDVLSLPPLLLEKYIAAAERLAAQAIHVPDPARAPRQRKEQEKLAVEQGEVSLRGSGTYSFSSNGAVKGEFEFRRAGEYAIRVRAGARQAGDEPARMQVRLDGEPLVTIDVRAGRESMQSYEHRQRVAGGKHTISVAFINSFYDEESRTGRRLYLEHIEVVGPLDVVPEELPQAHRQYVVSHPGEGKRVAQAAAECLRPLMGRAFRRPASEAEVARFAELVEYAAAQGERYERGLQVALSAVLVSPHFLFRVERDPDPNNPELTHALGHYELASRLSYFLWSSMPDERLFALAADGRLADENVLREQVRRMLADPKSQALVENFGGQWLNLRSLDEIAPDPQQFAGFDSHLRDDMRRETELFFAAVMREDRSILDFLDGDFTFVNERLGRHYGLPNVKGDKFVQVSLKGQPRAGVMTHASILTLTSNPTRTSPVKRGKWIMENILGTPPPDPPANVPDLEATQKARPNASLREQLEVHRQDPGCASCHRTMDALGFGFENFDAIGRWRDKEGKLRIDASGELPGGEKFEGPIDLVRILKQRNADFSRSLAGKMLVYALGRGLLPPDRCAVDKIVETLEKDDRFSTLVTGIVTSDPFRKRRGEGETP
jgi:hypothetical protein